MAPRPRFPYWPGTLSPTNGPKIRLQSDPHPHAHTRPRTSYLRKESRYDWLGRVPQHRNEVTHGAHDNEQMPNEVAVANPFAGKERHTHSVRDTAGQ